MKTIQIPESQIVLIKGQGVYFRLTAICLGTEAANEYMKLHLNESLIAECDDLCFIANEVAA